MRKAAALAVIEPETNHHVPGAGLPAIPEPEPEPQALEVVNGDGEINTTTDLVVNPATIGFQDFVGLLAQSQNLNTKTAAVSVVPRYYEFTRVGEATRGILMGYTDIYKKENGVLKKIHCVQWMTDGALYINGGVSLVSRIKQLNLAPGTPVEIVFAEKRGLCKVYDVKLLA